MPELPARVAVSGGAGFIGSHTVELLVQNGAQVLVIDDHSHACGEPLPPEAEVVRADVSSSGAVEALTRFRPDAVLHLATKGGVVRSLRDPAAHLQASLVNSVAFFSAALAAGARHLVVASSGGTIYGPLERLPAGEDLPPDPVSPYGASKAAEELYLRALGRLHGARTLSLRYGNVYGPRQDGTGEAGLVALTCVRLLKGERPVIYGDGRQTRDFVYVADVAAANVAALASNAGGALNVGTSRQTAVVEVVETLRSLQGSDLEADHQPGRAGELMHVALDPARAAEQLGWRPRVDVREGLAETLAYFKQRSSPKLASPLGG